MVHFDKTTLRSIRKMLVNGRVPLGYRFLILLLLFGLHFPFAAVTHLSQWIDGLLYPRLRQQQVREPVFIVANPRSGTTLLHGLMATDEEQFVAVKLWHTTLPAVSAQRIVRGLQWLDSRVGRPFGRLIGLIERTAFGGWDGVHNTGFGRHEEDEAIFYMAFATASLGLTYPDTDIFESLAIIDHLPPERRRPILKFYRDSVVRFMFANNESRRYLAKNVFSSGRIASIAEEFPDARFVHIVRHPYEAIPSFCSMFSMPGLFLRKDMHKDSEQVRAWARIGVAFYRHLHEVTSAWPSDRIVGVSYDELIDDPERTVRRIYTQLGLPITDTFASRLQEAAKRRGNFERKHSYSLEEFGLTAEWIHQELHDIFDAYGFEADHHAFLAAAE